MNRAPATQRSGMQWEPCHWPPEISMGPDQWPYFSGTSSLSCQETQVPEMYLGARQHPGSPEVYLGACWQPWDLGHACSHAPEQNPLRYTGFLA